MAQGRDEDYRHGLSRICEIALKGTKESIAARQQQRDRLSNRARDRAIFNGANPNDRPAIQARGNTREAQGRIGFSVGVRTSEPSQDDHPGKPYCKHCEDYPSKPKHYCPACHNELHTGECKSEPKE